MDLVVFANKRLCGIEVTVKEKERTIEDEKWKESNKAREKDSTLWKEVVMCN